MAPMETSRRLVPKVTAGSRPEPVRGVGFSAKGVLRNHDAGSARRPVPKEAVMHFYTGQHRFYCGVDLHTRTLSLCVLDQTGGVALEATLPPEPDRFLEAVAPYRDGLVGGCECLLPWYWLSAPRSRAAARSANYLPCSEHNRPDTKTDHRSGMHAEVAVKAELPARTAP